MLSQIAFSTKKLQATGYVHIAHMENGGVHKGRVDNFYPGAPEQLNLVMADGGLITLEQKNNCGNIEC